jgi:hypothetical protein
VAIGQDLLNVPFPEMIKSMGLAIAEAQYSLDEVGIRLAQMMSGEYEVETIDPNTGNVSTEKKEAYVTFDGEQLSLLELGFTPTFYQFVDTLIEIKVSISMSREYNYSRTRKSFSASGSAGHAIFWGSAKMKGSSVSASYAAKYQYSAEGSSLMRTKLVPVPAPAVLEERIRDVLDRKVAAAGGGGGA